MISEVLQELLHYARAFDSDSLAWAHVFVGLVALLACLALFFFWQYREVIHEAKQGRDSPALWRQDYQQLSDLGDRTAVRLMRAGLQVYFVRRQLQGGLFVWLSVLVSGALSAASPIAMLTAGLLSTVAWALVHVWGARVRMMAMAGAAAALAAACVGIIGSVLPEGEWASPVWLGLGLVGVGALVAVIFALFYLGQIAALASARLFAPVVDWCLSPWVAQVNSRSARVQSLRLSDGKLRFELLESGLLLARRELFGT